MDTNNSSKQMSGFVKSKLANMSFYKAAKPNSSPVPYGTNMVNKSTQPSSMQKVPSFSKLAGIFGGGGGGGSDGYFHGPNGGAGDSKVDLKAANYISSFKERLILEELNVATNEKIEMYRNHY